MINPTSSFILTHLLFIVTLIAGGMLTTLQASFTKVANSSRLAHMQNPSNGNGGAANNVQIDSVSDTILFAWAAGGSLCGAYIGIAVGLTHIAADKPGEHTTKSSKIAKAFAVSLLTGVVATPYIMHNYFSPARWSTVLVCGCGVSASAHGIWAMVNAIVAKFVSRAQKDGISGVIDEAKGK